MSSADERVAVAGPETIEPRAAAVSLEGDEARWRRSTRLDVGFRRSSYTSPLPSPDDLDRYAGHLKDVAERLMASGEKEQAHRHEIETRLAAIDEAAMPRFYEAQRFASWVSLILGLAYLGVMVLAIVRGYPLVGVGGAAVGIAAVIRATRRDPPDRRDASPAWEELGAEYRAAFEEENAP